MKRHLAFLLAPFLATGCVAVAAAGAGFIIAQQVLPNNVHVSQVAIDIDRVWPSVKETVGYFQEPGSDATVQESPREIRAKVDGAKVLVEVTALDMDSSEIRVTAEKYLSKDDATAGQVMASILDHLDKIAN